MQNLEQQIEQFWQQENQAADSRRLLEALERAEADAAWKEELETHYNKVLSGEAPGNFSEAQQRRVWQQLQVLSAGPQQALEKNIPHRGRFMWYRWTAAASVLLCIGLYLYPWNSKPRTLQARDTGNTTTAGAITVKANTSNRQERVLLPDSSVVLLAQGSVIRYAAHFEAHARNVQLEGKALFEVAKDLSRPFTVTAAGFATTALGTRFIVDAAGTDVSIRLVKGKIVVKATANAGMAMKAVYLAPGQELKIDTREKHFALRSPQKTRIHPPLNSKPGEEKKQGDDAAPLSFEKAPLAAVFQQLSRYYHTTILFDKTEVQGLSFTGSFGPSDELDLALNVVCNMNGLLQLKEDGRIIIRKK